jgi:hypothetical protein
VRAKITQQEIARGNKALLKTGPKKKPAPRAKSVKARSEYEQSSDMDEDPTVFQKQTDLKYGDFEDVRTKNKEEKIKWLDQLCEKLHKKMKFYQECDLNLLVYGVGSKRDFLNMYCHEQIRNQGNSCVIINGYHSGTNIKTLLGQLILYITRGTNQKKPTSLQD